MEKAPTNVNQKIRVTGFLNKLYSLVDDPSTNDYIRWTETGESFLVYKHEDFAKEILPKFFKHNNFSSFVRQLNMYGFHKVPHLQQGVMVAEQSSQESWEFSNPHFQQNQPDLLHFVVRNNRSKNAKDDFVATGIKLIENPKTSTDPSTPVVDSEINIKLEKLARELENTKDHQITLSTELKRLKRENALLWREAAATSNRFVRQQEGVEKIMKFLASVFSHDKHKPDFTNKGHLLLSHVPTNTGTKNFHSNKDITSLINEQDFSNTQVFGTPSVDKVTASYNNTYIEPGKTVSTQSQNFFPTSPSALWNSSSLEMPSFARNFANMNPDQLGNKNNPGNNLLGYSNINSSRINETDTSKDTGSDLHSFMESLDVPTESAVGDIVIPNSSIVQINSPQSEDTHNLQSNIAEPDTPKTSEAYKPDGSPVDLDENKSMETILADIIKSPSDFSDGSPCQKIDMAADPTNQQNANSESDNEYWNVNNTLLANNLTAKLNNSQNNTAMIQNQLIKSPQKIAHNIIDWSNPNFSLNPSLKSNVPPRPTNESQIRPIGDESPVRLLMTAISSCTAEQFEIFIRLFQVFDASNNYLPALFRQIDTNSKAGLGYNLSQLCSDPEFAKKAAILNERKYTNPGLYNILHSAAHGKLSWNKESESIKNVGAKYFEGDNFFSDMKTITSEDLNNFDDLAKSIKSQSPIVSKNNTKTSNITTAKDKGGSPIGDANVGDNIEISQSDLSDILSEYLKPTANNNNSDDNKSISTNSISNLYKQLELSNPSSVPNNTANDPKNPHLFDFSSLQNISNISELSAPRQGQAQAQAQQTSENGLDSAKVDYSLEDLNKVLLDGQSQHLFSQLNNSEGLANNEGEFPWDLNQLGPSHMGDYKLNNINSNSNTASSANSFNANPSDSTVSSFLMSQDGQNNIGNLGQKNGLNDLYFPNLSLLPYYNLTPPGGATNKHADNSMDFAGILGQKSQVNGGNNNLFLPFGSADNTLKNAFSQANLNSHSNPNSSLSLNSNSNSNLNSATERPKKATAKKRPLNTPVNSNELPSPKFLKS